MHLKGEKRNLWNKTLQNAFSLDCCDTGKVWLPKVVLSLVGKYFLGYLEFFFLFLSAGTKQRQACNSVKVNSKVNEAAVITETKVKMFFQRCLYKVFNANQSFFKENNTKTTNKTKCKTTKKPTKNPTKKQPSFWSISSLNLKNEIRNWLFFNITLAAYSDHQAFPAFLVLQSILIALWLL